MVAKAFTQSARLDRLISSGVIGAKALTTQVLAKIFAGYRRGERVRVADLVVEKLSPLLQRSFSATYLLGGIVATPDIQMAVTPLAKPLRDLKKLASASALERLSDLEDQFAINAFTSAQETGLLIETEMGVFVDGLILEGTPVALGVKALQEKFTTLGLAGPTPARLETLFRTQNQMVYNAAQWHTYQDPDVADLIWGFHYVTVGDDRVRPSHAALDGTILPKDDPFWGINWPPNGWNCRCQALPILQKMRIVLPRDLPDGSIAEPDRGFAFNPGFNLPVAASHILSLSLVA